MYQDIRSCNMDMNPIVLNNFIYWKQFFFESNNKKHAKESGSD
jgi:hypothetical protein